MLEKLVSQFSDLLNGSQDARGANAGGPAHMGEAGGASAPVTATGGNTGGALGAAIAKLNAATAAGLPPGVAGCSPIDRLPEAALRKYRELEAESGAAFAIIGALNEQLADARVDMARHEARIANLCSPDGGRAPDDSVGVTSARQQAKRARAEVARLSEQIKWRQDGSRSVRELFGAVESYVDHSLRNVGNIEAAPPVAVTPPTVGQIWGGLVEAKRQRLAKLREDLQSVIDAPRPSSVAKEMAREQIERLAARGAPGVMALLEGGDSITWATRMAPPMVVVGPDGSFAGTTNHDHSEIDTFAVFAWLNRDQLLQAIEREIAEAADDRSAMDEPTRAKKRRQAEAAILDVERLEEATICAAAEAGVPIERRSDADPRAILGLSDEMPPPDRGLI